ncbi:NAD(P)H:quinone oxidoreductase [Methanospirillum sp. J.3.6.1-F.2.7.3]|jgi:NAD(P)H dehydrogenase (quinone)|uniref:NAD(P)H dehydrogenase (quinone) n=1 Tax=Methanospirillum purgamenti TaxID=2834276 RepID=A0A8E7B385_9EURY|nr:MULTISPECIES: NAD(P)H:quinone oxidoreductase [Methanospirillum]MDX8550259.1 NAD(P)H:quinone oxidoreductase [Methanospirillum hungatei]QVV90353.1 NAD(P)H:quinone oxidoreductase [Methanospirillum sp. J.3.6.1-F.2.7.3]
MRIFIVYYSLYGHIHKMAQAVSEGVSDAGFKAELFRVPETLPDVVIEKMGATSFQTEFRKLPVITPDELSKADAVIFGTPTRFGNMVGQMRQFLDSTGGIWSRGALAGKVGSVFTSSGTQHGGQESTILSMHITLLHHGMIIAGLPYTFAGQTIMTEITGCSPYGASTIAGGSGERFPSDNELSGARYQGKYVARVAEQLAGKQNYLLSLS